MLGKLTLGQYVRQRSEVLFGVSCVGSVEGGLVLHDLGTGLRGLDVYLISQQCTAWWNVGCGRHHCCVRSNFDVVCGFEAVMVNKSL